MTPTTKADPRTRMHEIVNAAIPESGEFTTSDVADKVLSFVGEHEPDLLIEWAKATLEEWVRRTTGEVLRHRRAHFVASLREGEMVELLQGIVSGDIRSNPFALTYVVTPDHVRKHVGEMTGADHQFVADAYQRSAQTDLLLAAFHRAVARRVGDRRTDEVLGPDEYLRMQESILNRKTNPPT